MSTERITEAPSTQTAPREQHGVQAVEIGMEIAFALAEFGGPVALKDLAKSLKMPPSKVHRYLVSLCRSGLVAQEGRNSLYQLGGGAVQIGLAALRGLDEFQIAGDAIEELFDETGLTVGICVWGDHGPTVIRRREGLHHLSVMTRIGSNLSVIGTNAGRLFCAFMPRSRVDSFIDAEFRAGRNCLDQGRPLTRKEFENLLLKLKDTRIAFNTDSTPGVDAISAPVFDQDGEIFVVITIFGPRGTFPMEPDKEPAYSLRKKAEDLSRRVGYHQAST